MASDRQIAANRLNAQKSSGPRTPDGKRRSRQNALRHGLTAQTVIGALEDADEYRAFEADILAGCSPRSSVEHALASRLASLLWRLRRATAIESGLFEAEVRSLRQHPASDSPSIHKPDEMLRALFNLYPLPGRQEIQDASDGRKESASKAMLDSTQAGSQCARPDLAQTFLRLPNRDNGVLDRLIRYETSLWRQAAQTIVLLNTFKWRAQDQRRRPRCRFRPAQQRRHRFFPAQFYEPR
jgi:hypothetical protein